MSLVTAYKNGCKYLQSVVAILFFFMENGLYSHRNTECFQDLMANLDPPDLVVSLDNLEPLVAVEKLDHVVRPDLLALLVSVVRVALLAHPD